MSAESLKPKQEIGIEESPDIEKIAEVAGDTLELETMRAEYRALSAERQSGLSTTEIVAIRDEAKFFETLDAFEREARKVMRKAQGHLPNASPMYRRAANPPIENGEMFRPRKELGEVSKAPRNQKQELINNFKEKLAYQQEGLALVQEEMRKRIERQPDMPFEDLEHHFVKAGKEYGMNYVQRTVGREVLRRYVERRTELRALREEHPEDASLFEALYDTAPVGKVEIIDGPATFYVRCHDERDYSRAYYGGSEPNEAMVEQANRSGGANTRAVGPEKMQGAIIIENTKHIERNSTVSPYQKMEWSDDIRIHEEQHAIHALFDKTEMRTFTLDRLLDSVSEEDDELYIKSYVEYYREKVADERAKDEILAYFRDGHPAPAVYGILTQQDGLYDYLKDSERRAGELVVNEYGDEKLRTLVERAAKQVFGHEYSALVARGTAVPYILEKNGYSKEQAIALLTHEPLGKWERVAQRLFGDQAPKF